MLLFVLNQHPDIPNIRFLRISRAKSVPVLLQQPGKYIDFEALFPVQHGIFVHVISYNFSLCIIAPAYMWCFFIKMIHGQTIYVSRIVYITSCQSEWCCCKRCTDIESLYCRLGESKFQGSHPSQHLAALPRTQPPLDPHLHPALHRRLWNSWGYRVRRVRFMSVCQFVWISWNLSRTCLGHISTQNQLQYRDLGVFFFFGLMVLFSWQLSTSSFLFFENQY